jgi:retron-type reverse transcriptase
MKTYKNLYGKLCSIENLKLAFRKAKKRKSRKHYVKEFEANLVRELSILREELLLQSYKPKPLKRFIIRDPKTRVIHSSAFRDRVVHHALCNIMLPVFEKSFMFDSYANRKEKGVHKALKRFDVFLRRASKNGKLVKSAKNKNMTIGYVLKADIRHYFDSVDHEVMMQVISRKIKD